MSSKSFVKKDNEDKKSKIINGFIIGIFVILVVSMLVIVSRNNNNKIGNHIKEISYNEYKDKIKSDDFTIILLASPTCSHCQDYKPMVNALASENNLTVYYVNVSSQELKEEEYLEIRESVSATKEEYDSYGNPVIPTPATAVFKNGVEVSSELGDIGYDGFKSLLVKCGVIK